MLFLPNNFGASCFSQTIVIFQHKGCDHYCLHCDFCVVGFLNILSK